MLNHNHSAMIYVLTQVFVGHARVSSMYYLGKSSVVLKFSESQLVVSQLAIGSRLATTDYQDRSL